MLMHKVVQVKGKWSMYYRSKMSICSKCNKVITERTLSYCDNRYWHSSCLTCQMCGDSSVQSLYSYRGSLICKQDYYKINCVCKTCSRAIGQNELVVRLGKNYGYMHDKCVYCGRCRSKLGTGDRYMLTTDNSIVCHKCIVAVQGAPAASAHPPMMPAPGAAGYPGAGAGVAHQSPHGHGHPHSGPPPPHPAPPGSHMAQSPYGSPHHNQMSHQMPPPSLPPPSHMMMGPPNGYNNGSMNGGMGHHGQQQHHHPPPPPPSHHAMSPMSNGPLGAVQPPPPSQTPPNPSQTGTGATGGAGAGAGGGGRRGRKRQNAIT